MNRKGRHMLPTFHTKRLILRGPKLSDAPCYQRYFSNPNVMRQLSSGIPVPYPSNGAESFLRELILPNQGISLANWGIFLSKNPEELIGGIELRFDETDGQRGFWLGEPFWGQGIMSEAVIPVTDYAFNEMGFDQLILVNAVGNYASARIKEKQGAKFLRIENARFVDENSRQRQVWKLTKTRWFEWREKNIS